MSENLSFVESHGSVFESVSSNEPEQADTAISPTSKRLKYGTIKTGRKSSLLRECLQKRGKSVTASDQNCDATPQRYRNEVVCTALCCSGNLAQGFAYGLASPAVPKLLASGALTEDQAAWFESLLNLGALAGGLCVGLLIGCLGRRGTILLSGVPFFMGWILIAVSTSYQTLYVGRLLTGVGYGMVQVACPIYIAETVSKEVRGSLSLAVVLACTSGVLGQYILGLVLDTTWLALVSLAPVLLMLVGMGLMPESPRWLISKGRNEQALQNLIWLRASKVGAVLQEYDEIVLNLQSLTAFQHVCSMESLRHLQMSVKPLAVCMMLFVFQQLSGITPVMFNAQFIFEALDLGEGHSFLKSGQLPAIALAVFKMVATILGLLLIDRAGRRPLYIVCGTLMSLCCLSVGVYVYYADQTVVGLPWLPLCALALYVAAYSMAWGGIPWVVISEIIPLRYRGLATSLGAIGTWVTAFVVTQEFFDLVHALSLWGVFILFGATCLLGSLFAFCFMPETKLRSLESIEYDISISIHT